MFMDRREVWNPIKDMDYLLPLRGFDESCGIFLDRDEVRIKTKFEIKSDYLPGKQTSLDHVEPIFMKCDLFAKVACYVLANVNL